MVVAQSSLLAHFQALIDEPYQSTSVQEKSRSQIENKAPNRSTKVHPSSLILIQSLPYWPRPGNALSESWWDMLMGVWGWEASKASRWKLRCNRLKQERGVK
jgi:hypothetical protein